ncbi:MAG TPA: phosphatase PAP2 family protein [Stenotrophomonas sp.]|nr:phosphatase PAP2 family protein [Stenotrophomonas sp.]
MISAAPSGSPHPSAPLDPPSLLTHLWLPSLALLVLSYGLMAQGGDQALADALYRLQGGQWRWQDVWLTEQLLHRGGRMASVGAGLLLIAAAVRAWRRPRGAWRWPLTTLAASIALSTALVSRLKAWTQVDCPWDLLRYGGDRPLLGLFEANPAGQASGCFPAGHASAGYAWVGLYFFARATRPQWRCAGLAIGLLAGLLFGFCQQLRGAHFLSHDLWSLAVCWGVPLALFRWMPQAPVVQEGA